MHIRFYICYRLTACSEICVTLYDLTPSSLGLFADMLQIISQMILSWSDCALDFVNYGLIDALYHVIPLVDSSTEQLSENVHALQV